MIGWILGWLLASVMCYDLKSLLVFKNFPPLYVGTSEQFLIFNYLDITREVYYKIKMLL